MTRFLVELRAGTSEAEQRLAHAFRPANLRGVDEMFELPAMPNMKLPFALQIVTQDLHPFQASAVVARLLDISGQIPDVTALPTRPANRTYRAGESRG